jgi:DNA-binding SARP family transcriptional activator
MPGLEVGLLGEVSLRRAGAGVTVGANRSLELLVYLLLNRRQPHSREQLCEVLWPQDRADAARRYMRQALWRLNVALAGVVVTSRSGLLRVDPAAIDHLDVEEIDAVQAETADVRGADLGPELAGRVRRATESFGGDLLAGWPQEWCLAERQRLQQVRLELTERLISHHDAAGRPALAVRYGHEVLALDPARETTHRLLMRAHERAGDRASAVRQYQRCVAALAEELGVAPTPETVRLYRRIRADGVEPHPVVPAPVVPSAVEPYPAVPAPVVPAPARPDRSAINPAVLIALGDRLDELQATLDALRLTIGARHLTPADRRVRPGLHLRDTAADAAADGREPSAG